MGSHQLAIRLNQILFVGTSKEGLPAKSCNMNRERSSKEDGGNVGENLRSSCRQEDIGRYMTRHIEQIVMVLVVQRHGLVLRRAQVTRLERELREVFAKLRQHNHRRRTSRRVAAPGSLIFRPAVEKAIWRIYIIPTVMDDHYELHPDYPRNRRSHTCYAGCSLRRLRPNFGDRRRGIDRLRGDYTGSKSAH